MPCSRCFVAKAPVDVVPGWVNSDRQLRKAIVRRSSTTWPRTRDLAPVRTSAVGPLQTAAATGTVFRNDDHRPRADRLGTRVP
jgi:hypothetical protein